MKFPSNLAANVEYGLFGKTPYFEGTPGWALELSTWGTTATTGQLIFYITNNVTWPSASVSAIISSDVWHHVVTQRVSGEIRLYVDGVLKSANLSSETAGNVDNPYNFNIGTLFSVSYIGKLDEFGIWNRALNAKEIEQLYRRGANRNRFQLRVCSAADCADDPYGDHWQGPDGTNQSYFSEENNLGVTPSAMSRVLPDSPALTLSAFPSFANVGRYFQYRAILESDDSSSLCNYGSGATWCSPELTSVAADPVHYRSSPIVGKVGVAFHSLSNLAETLGGGACPGGIGYNLGLGDRYSDSVWYRWDGAAWVVSDGAAESSNSASTVSTNASTFHVLAGQEKVFIKTFLKADNGTTGCELERIQLDGLR